jgi:hypothetical protein
MDLKREAREYAHYLQQQAIAVQQEIDDLKKQIDERQKKIDAAKFADERVETFREKLGGEFRCPRCWIDDMAMEVLKPIPSKTRDDYFSCDKCGASFKV